MKVKIFISPKMNFFFDLLPATMQNRLVLILYMYLVLHIVYYPYKKLQITNDMTLKKKQTQKLTAFYMSFPPYFWWRMKTILQWLKQATFANRSYICSVWYKYQNILPIVKIYQSISIWSTGFEKKMYIMNVIDIVIEITNKLSYLLYSYIHIV